MKLSKIYFLILIFTISAFSKGMPNEYYKIKNTNKAKTYFFEYIYKLSKNENNKIKDERSFVKKIFTSNIKDINAKSKDFLKLQKLQKKYRIKDVYDLKSYMSKIDIIPPAMVLAQAAVESGWGKSRFMKKANNIFGHWTYNPKIGIVPQRRKAGAKHFIRVFRTVQDSISAYMLNLNRNSAYKSLHKKRYQERAKNRKPSGLVLSQTIINYSGIGRKYLSILKSVIRKNKLEKYDRRFYQQIK